MGSPARLCERKNEDLWPVLREKTGSARGLERENYAMPVANNVVKMTYLWQVLSEEFRVLGI
jgi:hypothetical protein